MGPGETDSSSDRETAAIGMHREEATRMAVSAEEAVPSGEVEPRETGDDGTFKGREILHPGRKGED